MQNKDNFLNNQLLIATPALDQGMFKASVTYICQHDEEMTAGPVACVFGPQKRRRLANLRSERFLMGENLCSKCYGHKSACARA